MKKRLLSLAFALVLLVLPVRGLEWTGAIADGAGLLTAQELGELDAQAQAIAAEYGCGLYVVTVDDYLDYGDDPWEAACNLYTDYELGVGPDRDGFLLMLSMADRDYSTTLYGPWAHRVFTDRVLQLQEDEFLDNLADDDWSGGFADFLGSAGRALAAVQSGQSVTAQTLREPKVLTPAKAAKVVLQDLAIGLAVGLLVCFGLKAGMRSVRKGTSARVYMDAGAGNLTVCTDQFIRATQTRRTIETTRSSGGGGGGSSHSGGGFSGRSGKF